MEIESDDAYEVTELIAVDPMPGPVPAPKVSLIFEPAGGAFNGDTKPAVVKAAAGEIVKILAAPTRDGYTFLYWTDSDGREYRPGDEYIVTGDHAFTAVWEKDSGGPEEDSKPDDPSSDHGKNKTKDGTDTGDSAPVAPYLAVFAVAVVALGVLVKHQ